MVEAHVPGAMGEEAPAATRQTNRGDMDSVGGKIQLFTEIHTSGGHISYSSENVQLKEIRTWHCNNRINNLHMTPQHREMGKTRARLKTLNGNQLAPNSN